MRVAGAIHPSEKMIYTATCQERFFGELCCFERAKILTDCIRFAENLTNLIINLGKPLEAGKFLLFRGTWENGRTSDLIRMFGFARKKRPTMSLFIQATMELASPRQVKALRHAHTGVPLCCSAYEIARTFLAASTGDEGTLVHAEMNIMNVAPRQECLFQAAWEEASWSGTFSCWPPAVAAVAKKKACDEAVNGIAGKWKCAVHDTLIQETSSDQDARKGVSLKNPLEEEICTSSSSDSDGDGVDWNKEKAKTKTVAHPKAKTKPEAKAKAKTKLVKLSKLLVKKPPVPIAEEPEKEKKAADGDADGDTNGGAAKETVPGADVPPTEKPPDGEDPKEKPPDGEDPNEKPPDDEGELPLPPPPELLVEEEQPRKKRRNRKDGDGEAWKKWKWPVGTTGFIVYNELDNSFSAHCSHHGSLCRIAKTLKKAPLGYHLLWLQYADIPGETFESHMRRRWDIQGADKQEEREAARIVGQHDPALQEPFEIEARFLGKAFGEVEERMSHVACQSLDLYCVTCIVHCLLFIVHCALCASTHVDT